MNTSIEGYPLSPQQRRLWSLLQSGSAYNACCLVRIDGPLQAERLQQALAQSVQRHEILRTHYSTPVGRALPFQVIAPALAPEWQEMDLRSLTPKRQEEEAAAHYVQEQSRVFDYEQGSLVAATLLRLSNTETQLILTLPAMSADTRSLDVLVQEISRNYADIAATEEESGALQYADISAWFNNLLSNDAEGALAREYWSRCDLTSSAPLFGSDEAGDRKSGTGIPETYTVEISADLVRALQAQQAVPAQIFLFGCWQTLLSRITGRYDTPVGFYSHGRPFEELRATIGLLAKWLPIRCNDEAQTRFNTLLDQAQQTIREATEHQEYFTWEQQESASSGSLRFLPYGFEYWEQTPTASGGAANAARFTIVRQSSHIERFDLMLSCRQSAEDALTLTFAFDPTLHTRTDIARLAGQFTTLLQSALQQPEAPVEALDILPQDQRQQLLVEWNHTNKDFPNLAVHHLFERHASTFSDAPALVCEGRQLSYRELNNRANQVAHWLLEQGVQPDTTVGLFLHRSIEAIVGMLAILKAGAAYLPLDPAFPKERLQFMLKDSQTNLVLTQQSLLDSLTGFEGTTLCLDSEWDTLQNQSQNNPATSVSLSDLVYVIYTSGSTGNPKGVLVEHRGLSNYVHSLLSRLQLPTGAKYASVSTLAADLGNTVVFGALCSGGCLHLIPADTAMDASALGAYIQQEEIDCLKIVPSHLSALLAGSEGGEVLPRQVLVLGGEASSWNLIDRVKSVSPSLRVFNHYGPTETTVGVLMLSVEGVERGRRVGVPLGRPLENVRVYVLDSRRQPVPIGVLGELYIGGSQVARGYLNRPDLTQDRFLADPFQQAGRLYRTGDVVRYREDGLLEFVGRGDDQVKIRGYRIELGEIESRLREHPRVKEAVVLARDEGTGDKCLVAYVVGSQPGQEEADTLRAYLSERLPEYMIPGNFLWLNALPLS